MRYATGSWWNTTSEPADPFYQNPARGSISAAPALSNPTAQAISNAVKDAGAITQPGQAPADQVTAPAQPEDWRRVYWDDAALGYDPTWVAWQASKGLDVGNPDALQRRWERPWETGQLVPPASTLPSATPAMMVKAADQMASHRESQEKAARESGVGDLTPITPPGVTPPEVTEPVEALQPISGYTRQQSDYLRSLNSPEILDQAAASEDPQGFMRQLAQRQIENYNPMNMYNQYLGGTTGRNWDAATFGYTWGQADPYGGMAWIPALSSSGINVPRQL